MARCISPLDYRLKLRISECLFTSFFSLQNDKHQMKTLRRLKPNVKEVKELRAKKKHTHSVASYSARPDDDTPYYGDQQQLVLSSHQHC